MQVNMKSTNPVEVITEDVTLHPICLHGPTLLYSTGKGRYYSCSMCRNKKDCSIHIDEEDWQKEGVRKRNEKYYQLIPKIDKHQAWKHFQEIKTHHSATRGYCDTCQEFFVTNKTKKHAKNHKVVVALMDEQLTQPSTWLPPLENDKIEAQYLFSTKSSSTVLGILKNNNIKNILCIGTPSVHEAAGLSPEFNSILLDYDKRHSMFNPPSKFIWYNMFNNYMFNGNEDDAIVKKFMKSSKNEGLAIVIDPPFGGRVEPIVHTLKELSAAYNEVCETSNDGVLPIIWAFPYFSEPYIVNLLPELKMHDYQVEYKNHLKFQNGKKGRKFGTPVRFFTNLPFSTINLANDSKYKLCEKCKYWVSATNKHCDKCKQCTSKNGMTYTHCTKCRRCVKPTFFHCEKCNRCCQEKGHICAIVESQSCYNCQEKGHKRSACPQLIADQKPVNKRRKN